uniref:NtCtMGAM_N domain-containing protein n=1 Tax=Heterorhabditis bacteriophora TaxID=37862 RepID=A0A1I7XBP7_HETBA
MLEGALSIWPRRRWVDLRLSSFSQKNAPIGTPWCYYPRESGFKIYQQNSNYYQLVSGFNNAYGSNISPINVNVRQNGKTLRVIIGAYDRYVPPINIPQLPSVTEESLQFSGTNIPGTDFFAFKIIRKSTLTNIWDTTIGGLQFADKFIQIATFLPSMNIFGFGEHIHHKLKHDLSRYTVWPMFARDIAPDSGSTISTQNLYGVHPFYICVENDGKAHGVLILNSNAQEVALGPGPHLVYRTIGGQLDLAFFPGPTPEMVVEQYLAHIGTPFLPAYWALGFQLSRWGYKNLTDMQHIVRRVQAAGIPLDVPYADIDYMRHDEDFTEGNWSDFPAYVDQLHNEGLHVILIFDPAIEVDYGSFKRAIDQEASFIEWATNAQVPKSIQDQYPMVKGTKARI